MTTLLAWLIPLLAGLAMVGLGAVGERIAIWQSVGVAAALRVGYALVVSRAFTPNDVRTYFLHTATDVLIGKDPLLDLPSRQWNFLEVMPWLHALEYKTGVPWVYAVKILPVLADVLLVWLVARLSTERARTRALQYALNPLSLFVVSLHGQVEPIALALALSGLLFIRNDRLLAGGLLLGAAVATKTWPFVVLVAALPLKSPLRAARILAGAVVIPIAALLSGLLLLDTRIGPALQRLSSYSGYVSSWSWSGLMVTLKLSGTGYDQPLARLGTLLIAAGTIVILVLLRNRPVEDRALGVLAVVLLATAGFGPQYLLFVAPLSMARSGWVRLGYMTATGLYAGVSYLTSNEPYLRGLSWVPWVFVVGILIDLVHRAWPTLSTEPLAPFRHLFGNRPTVQPRPESGRFATTPGQTDPTPTELDR